MKKTKQSQASKSTSEFPWWPIAAAAASFLLVWIVYGPALNGPFVFDDRFQIFLRPEAATVPFLSWIRSSRPLLLLTLWLNYQAGGTSPFGYHLVNVLIHYAASCAVGFCTARLLELAGTPRAKSIGLGLFGGALFLLHPLQTESVSYVVSRSEPLSILLCFSAFALYLYRPEGPIRWGRTLAITALFALALTTKEHTITLPALLLLTDAYFDPKAIRQNVRLYGLFAVLGIAGAVATMSTLRVSTSAGLNLDGLSPATYAFTQMRMLWLYTRYFFLPIGQNFDADISLSHTLLENGAIFGGLALIAAVGAAWFYRKSWPLASYGFLVFLVLLAPTSSVIPILDVFAEHRLYLPFIGLTLLSLELLRRLNVAQATWACIAILAICSALTFQRNRLWGDSVLLWSDAVSKSPKKSRPNFQLAYAYYERNQCANALPYFEIAGAIDKRNPRMLFDWAMTYECLGRYQQGLDRLQLLDTIEPSASTKASMAILYGGLKRWPDVLRVLDEAEKQDPKLVATYTYRGDYYEVQGDYAAAAEQYRKALALSPGLQKAEEALARVTRRLAR